MSDDGHEAKSSSSSSSDDSKFLRHIGTFDTPSPPLCAAFTRTAPTLLMLAGGTRHSDDSNRSSSTNNGFIGLFDEQGNKLQLNHFDVPFRVLSMDVVKTDDTWIVLGLENGVVQIWEFARDMDGLALHSGDLVHHEQQDVTAVSWLFGGDAFIATADASGKVLWWPRFPHPFAKDARPPTPVHSINLERSVQFMQFCSDGNNGKKNDGLMLIGCAQGDTRFGSVSLMRVALTQADDDGGGSPSSFLVVEPLRTIAQAHGEAVTCGSFFPSGGEAATRFVTGGADGRLKVWKVPQERSSSSGASGDDYHDSELLLSEKEVHCGEWVRSVGFISGGERLLSCGDDMSIIITPLKGGGKLPGSDEDEDEDDEDDFLVDTERSGEDTAVVSPDGKLVATMHGRNRAEAFGLWRLL